MASQLLIDEPPLQVLPSLAKRVGLNEAIILQQVHYWLNPKLNKNIFDGCHWVHNTYGQWQKQFPFWAEKTIRRAIGNLEESELLTSFVTRDFKKTKYYTINYALMDQFKKPHCKDNKLEDLGKYQANEGLCPSGQNDQIDGSKRADRPGQNDQIDPVKMTTFYNTENTTENTPPLLSSPPEESQGEEEEEEHYKKMIVIWNEVVQKKLHPGKDVRLTSQRVKKLKHIRHEVFENSLDAWKSYCQQIADNGFLMGENASGFRVTFDWALSTNNACKILEGAIYDKEKGSSQKSSSETEGFSYVPLDEFFKELEDKLKDIPHAETWIPVCKILAPRIGQFTFKKWFWDIVPLGFSKDAFVLQAENKDAADYIIKNYARDLAHAVLNVYPDRNLKENIIKSKPEEEQAI